MNHPSAPHILELHLETSSQRSTTASTTTKASSASHFPTDQPSTPSRSDRHASLPATATTSASLHRTGSSNRGRHSEEGSTMHVTSGADKTPSVWPIGDAILKRRKMFVDNCSEQVRGFKRRSWNELATSAMVCCRALFQSNTYSLLHVQTRSNEMSGSCCFSFQVIPINDMDDPSSSKQAVLIVGLNSRGPFDADYRSWVRLLQLQLSSGLAAVISIENQLQRAEEVRLGSLLGCGIRRTHADASPHCDT